MSEIENKGKTHEATFMTQLYTLRQEWCEAMPHQEPRPRKRGVPFLVRMHDTRLEVKWLAYNAGLKV